MGNTLPANFEEQCFGNVPTPCDMRTIFSDVEGMLGFAESQEILEQYVAFFEQNIPDFYIIDQQMLRDIVTQQLHFEFEEVFFQKNFDNIDKISLQRITNELTQCIAVHYPPLCDWLATLQKNRDILHNTEWLEIKINQRTDREVKNSISLAQFFRILLHTMLVFEILGKIAATDWTFQNNMRKHYKSKIDQLTNWSRVSKPAYIKSYSVAKAYSIATKICHSTNKTPTELVYLSKLGRFTLTLNVLEAVIYDWVHATGNEEIPRKQRASAGYILVMTPIGIITCENNQVKTEMSAEYACIYFVWNLAYVLQFPHPNLYIAKLLQPYVACAQPNDFIYRRMQSLFMAATSSTIDSYTENTYIDRLPNQSEWLNLLVEIVYRYAKSYFYHIHKIEFQQTSVKQQLRNIPNFINNLRRFLLLSSDLKS